MPEPLITRLVRAQRRRVVSRLCKEILALYGVEIPNGVRIGTDLNIVHRGFGVVISQSTVIGDRVTIYHGVTIGRADAGTAATPTGGTRIVIGDDVVLYPGAKIIAPRARTLLIGNGAAVGANAVVNRDVGPGEVWAGVPARCIGRR